VLTRQPEPRRNFVVRTSILRRLSAPLCDAVLESDNSAELLVELEQANLFLIALDDHREWYRYHHLFAQLLGLELGRREPELVPVLHRRAAAWHQNAGHWEAAIYHAVNGGDFVRAGTLIAQQWLSYTRRGQTATVQRWLDWLPDDFVLANPPMGLLRAWVAGLCNAPMQEVERWLAAAEASDYQGPPPAGLSSVQFGVALVRAVNIFDDVGGSLRAARQTLDAAGPRASEAYWMAMNVLGRSLYLSGQAAEARPILQDIAADRQQPSARGPRTQASRRPRHGARPGQAPRAHPEEAGQLLARFPLFWWDHVLTLLGTGLRFGELAGLRRRRVRLDRPVPVLQVVDTRYQAGRFGSGFKPRPKSDAGIRPVPLAPLVVEAIRRQLPPGNDPEDLVFTGPGGGPGRPGGAGMPKGTRTVLSRHNFHRTYHAAVAKLADPTGALRPPAARVLKALRLAGGPQTTDQLTAGLAEHGRAVQAATVQVALGELVAAALVAGVGEGAGQRWLALPTARDPLVAAVDLRGAHDFRHTFATWLEDAGIPARVIDELVGHEATSHAGQQRGSAMGPTTGTPPREMAARVAAAVEQRLRLVLEVAERALEEQPNRVTRRVFCDHEPRFLANLWQTAPRAEAVEAKGLVELRGFEPLTLACHAIRTMSQGPLPPCSPPHQPAQGRGRTTRRSATRGCAWDRC
jgi:integrase